MAKSISNTLSKYNKLNKLINDKVAKSGDNKFDVFRTFKGINEFISSGIYIVNAQLSGSLFGGLPNTRSMEIAGMSGCLPPDENIRVYIMKTNSVDKIKIEKEK